MCLNLVSQTPLPFCWRPHTDHRLKEDNSDLLGNDSAFPEGLVLGHIVSILLVFALKAFSCQHSISSDLLNQRKPSSEHNSCSRTSRQDQYLEGIILWAQVSRSPGGCPAESRTTPFAWLHKPIRTSKSTPKFSFVIRGFHRNAVDTI